MIANESEALVFSLVYIVVPHCTIPTQLNFIKDNCSPKAGLKLK